ncbi:MAG: TonB-dependent receptor [Ignavibacteria bacterium]|jgi:outer membrane receptor protein involved in Fe transport
MINLYEIKKLVFLFLLFLLTATLQAQTGKVAGLVRDSETNEPLPFINIIIINLNLGAATDIEGHYQILNVPPGTYEIKASSVGYSSQTFKDVKISINLTTNIDFELTPSSYEFGEEIIVVAERPIVTKDLTASTAIIDNKEIASLPLTEISEVLQLQAGIIEESVRGGRGGEVLYMVDGVPVTDFYDGSNVVEVNANAVQEMQFISGAFNAEYGNALSGVVNIATKEGNNEVRGFVSSFIGDHVSNATNIFRGIDKIDPLSIYNFEGSSSFPVIKNNLFVYLNGRYNNDDGYYYGKYVYNPWDITTIVNPDSVGSSKYDIQQTGSGELVPMNSSKKFYGIGRVTLTAIPNFKLNYSLTYNTKEYKLYNHEFAYNPYGDLNRFENSFTNIFSVTHTLSSSTFYKVDLSYFKKEYKHYVYEDVHDLRYTHSSLLSQEPQESPSFNTGGTNAQHSYRDVSSYSAKFDFTSQIHKNHMIKFGVSFSQNNLSVNEFELLEWIDKNGNGVYNSGEEGVEEPDVSGNPYVLTKVPDAQDPDENLSITLSEHNPFEFSFYIQDKIELMNLIINLGVRFDYFEPAGKILADPTDPDIYRPRRPENTEKTIEERRTYWYKDASAKSQLSPRIGFSFPITDRGVFHFSYGHFFQTPKYSLLYYNPEYKFTSGTGNLGIAGNPDLKPEQTISGEVGLQQALTDDVVIDVTAYFRDIRNLTGTRADEIYLYGGAGKYSQYVNSDFGFVKGVVFTLNKRYSNNWSAKIDYTLQSAKGNASDPDATRNQLASGEQPEVQLVPLDWDQGHTLNVSVNYSSDNHWGGSVLFRYGSGLPYTPSQSMTISKLLNNSQLKPYTLNVDLKFYYDFFFKESTRLTLFTRIYNLFDIQNELQVYSDSGTADFTLEEYNRRNDGSPSIVNSLDEYYRNPSYYSAPRLIEIGASFYF